MPVTETFEVPERQEYKAVPADVYQVVIDDIEVRTGKKYMSDEEQKQFLFKSRIIDDGENKDHGLGFYVSIKWFAGGKSLQPSKLFNLFKAIYSHYYKSVDLTKWSADMIKMDTVNDLIGKQVRVTVEDKEGKNKVTGFMAIKKEIKTKQLEEKEAGGSESVNPDDIPF